ncbi:MAG: sporulation protein YunB, partial [Clostridia bacterium]
INQTRHKIVLEVITTVEVIVPTSHKKLETITPVLIAENLIVGKIPEFYLNGAIIGSSGAK